MLHGEQIVISQWDSDSEQYVAIGACKGCDIQAIVDTIETATPTSSEFRTFKSFRKGWTIKMDHLVLTPTSVLKTGYTYSLGVMVTEDGTTSRAVYGLAICQQADIQATRGQLARGSFTFVGTGALSADYEPAPPSPDVPDTTTILAGDLIVNGTSITVNGEEVATQSWVLAQIGGGGVDMAAVWSALAAATSEQINISHLDTALSGYALTSSIPTNNNQLTNGAGYITAAALSGYATQSWVTNTALNGYALTSQIPTNNNQLTNGAGYITNSALNGYATESWVTGTALSGYAKTSAIPTNNNQLANGAGYITSSGSCSYASSAGSVAWENVTSRPTKVSAFTNDSGYITSSGSCSYATSSGTSSACSGNSATATTASTCSGNSATATKLANSRTLWGQSFDGSGNVTGAMSSVTNIDSLLYFDTTNGKIGIGVTPAYVFHVNGDTYIDGYIRIGNVQLVYDSSNSAIKVVGLNNEAANLYATGGISALGYSSSSDERLKDVIDYKALPTIDEIADAPAIHYKWKDNKDLGTQVGSIAQYWQKVMPEAVHEDDKGYLSMQYDVLALTSAISLAKKVKAQEKRIGQLEAENAQLWEAINELKIRLS